MTGDGTMETVKELADKILANMKVPEKIKKTLRPYLEMRLNAMVGEVAMKYFQEKEG